MATNILRDIGSEPIGAFGEDADSTGVMQRVWLSIQQAVCALHGHDTLLHFEGNRMFLRCSSCGHETPGWAIDETAPRRRFAGEPRRHLLVHSANLVGSRRVA